MYKGDLLDKILITGSGGGIASELIRQLKERDVQVVGIDLKTSCTAVDIPIHCDLSNEQQIRKAFDLYKDDLKNITGIVHLAGIYPNLSLSQYDLSLWQKVHAVNVTSLFIIVQLLLEQGCDRLRNIICTSSTAAKVGSRDPAYASSKAALLGLSKSLSLSLAPKGIRVNSILPGIIDTDMSKVQTSERRDYHRKKTLSNTIGRPEEVANVIAFLLGDSSSYIWGASIDINGGMTF